MLGSGLKERLEQGASDSDSSTSRACSKAVGRERLEETLCFFSAKGSEGSVQEAYL